MGLLTSLLTLPATAPVKGTVWIAKKIHETADSELNDPASIRKALRLLEAELDAGRIDEDAFEAEEEILLLRLKGMS